MSTLGEIFLTAKDSESFYKLTGAQKKIILFLALHGGQRMGEVAHLISSSMPAASAVIDRLEALGFVDRKRDNVDRRVVMVELTDAGRKAHEEMARVREQRLGVLFESMSDAHRQEFVGGLNRIHDIVRETAQRAESGKPSSAQ
jgi:DNA-binding MarR family transcriptional regulator